jgi:hypothetical protein
LAEVDTNPVISYRDLTNGDLKYAYYSPVGLQIMGITTENTTLTIGSVVEKAQLAVFANDPTATVTWSASTGSFDDPASKTPIYSPPAVDASQKVTLYVDVSDGVDVVQGSIDVVITNLANLGAALDFTHPSWGGPSTAFFSYADDRKVILLNFGASWDGFSMLDLPNENGLYGTYKNDGYYWILDWEDTVAVMQNLFSTNGYECTDAFEDTGLVTSQAYSDTFGTGLNAIPEHALIDRDGDVRKFAYGSINSDAAWEDAIKELLGIP